jgi:hypothetical protein
MLLPYIGSGRSVVQQEGKDTVGLLIHQVGMGRNVTVARRRR